MGYCAQPQPGMGDFHVEVRSQSFKVNAVASASQPYVYPDPYAQSPMRQGSVEFLIADIPALRAAIDQAERISSGNKLPDE